MFKQLPEIPDQKMVGASRFERPTSCSQGRRANQAALRPDFHLSKYAGIPPSSAAGYFTYTQRPKSEPFHQG